MSLFTPWFNPGIISISQNDTASKCCIFIFRFLLTKVRYVVLRTSNVETWLDVVGAVNDAVIDQTLLNSDII